MSTAIQTTDLAVGYRSRRARHVVLQDLNISVNRGELVCLLGTNGTGKSTLLKTVARLQPPLAGSVQIEGLDLQRYSHKELAQRVGVVLTERPLVGALTARQLVELGRYPYWDWSGRMRAQDHEAVQWAIDAVGGEDLASRDCMTLSDGERQRFMVARALAQEPSLLLLDEPTAFLDMPSRVEVMGLLRRLAREQHLAIVVSTHDLELGLRMADTIWLIGRGSQLKAGTPEDIILEGGIAEAFQGESVRFHPQQRAFRIVTGFRGCAVVQGEGLHAVLAAAVLEREGFEVVNDGAGALRITIASGSTRWELSAGESRHEGDSFSTLAALARQLGGGSR